MKHDHHRTTEEDGVTVYNELDQFAAAWIGELIQDNLIAQGTVDARDIRDIVPTELVGHRQVHLFAGIGVWSLALRLAGVPDDAEVWTASCPCQPFSAAGKRGGTSDERHLWPAAFHLISNALPRLVMGEQVASPDGLAWLDVVLADLEAEGYATRAVDLCAAGVGSPHIRQRLYWMAYAGCLDRSGRRDVGDVGSEEGNAQGETWQRERMRDSADNGCGAGWLADANVARPQGRRGVQERADQLAAWAGGVERDRRAGPTNGLWRDPDWLLCRDAKWRPVESGTFPLAHAGAFRNRVGMLRGAGNAINVAQAAAFIQANRDVI